MPTASLRKSALSTAALTLVRLTFAAFVLCSGAEAQTGVANGASPVFTPGNLVVVVEGCGVNGGTCTSIPSGNGTGGTGTAPGTSTVGGYGDNQASPFTLFQYTPNGTTAPATFAGSFVVPQTASGANLPVSAEYGSSSEGALSLSGAGQYLTFMGYGINAATFDVAPATYGAAPSLALAQSGSLTGQSYTPVPRVVVTIDPNGNINTSTAVYNVFDTNNPRSVYTLDGLNAWISGQGNGTDATSGVFYTPLGAVNNAPTAITGLDAASSTASNQYGQDTRNVQVYNNTLYVSVDTKGGKNSTRSYLGTLGTPPSTGLYQNNAGPTEISLSNNATPAVAVTSNGKITLTASETNGINSTGNQVNLSPSGFFFASPSVLYIADTGNSKQTSANTLFGDGGLQKWVNTAANGSGQWQLAYTMAGGLNLVANPNQNPSATSGATGLYSLAGMVSSDGKSVSLYVVNANIADLDPTYLYGITDSLAATTNPGTSFTLLATAPPDSNFKGVSFAPQYPAGSATLTTVPSGLTVTTAGTGCVPGTYVTPVTLIWTPNSVCTLTTTATQMNGTTPEAFQNWQDNKTTTTESVVAQSSPTTYTATFVVPGVTAIATSSMAIVLNAATTPLTASVAYNGPTPPSASTISFTVNGIATGIGATTCTGTSSPIVCTATYGSSSLVAGKYPIVATAGAATSSSGAAISGSGTLTVAAATDFSFASGATASQTITRGSAATFTFALGLTQASYPGTVSFSASGLPSGATATFSPATVSATSPAQSVTLTIQTSSSVSAVAPSMRSRIEYGSIAMIAALLLPLCLRRRLSRLALVLLIGGSLVAMTGLAGCSGKTAATTPGSVTYPVVVTATSGSASHAATVSLTVN